MQTDVCLSSIIYLSIYLNSDLPFVPFIILFFCSIQTTGYFETTFKEGFVKPTFTVDLEKCSFYSQINLFAFPFILN